MIGIYIIIGLMFAACLWMAIVCTIWTKDDKREREFKRDVALYRLEKETEYFTFKSDDDKVIKAFKIVADKDVHVKEFIELSREEFDLLKEALL